VAFTYCALRKGYILAHRVRVAVSYDEASSKQYPKGRLPTILSVHFERCCNKNCGVEGCINGPNRMKTVTHGLTAIEVQNRFLTPFEQTGEKSKCFLVRSNTV